MFTNLIESHSHRQEFKRRSSFFLATVAGYSMIIFAALVVGVLTYDAQVEAQTTEIVGIWIPPVNHEPEGPRPIKKAAAVNNDRPSPKPMRPVLYESPSNPTKPPDTVSVDPNPIPPAPANAIEGPRVSDPAGSTSDRGCEGCSGNDTKAPPVVENRTPPSVVEPVKQPTKTITSVIIASKAVNLPKPAYPIIAKQARAQGPVNVQILVDVDGRVISAQAVKGNPMLTRAAEDAARRARFTPTTLNGEPVKVQGVITYNFVLQ
jgi:periplasmic protein TonB